MKPHLTNSKKILAVAYLRVFFEQSRINKNVTSLIENECGQRKSGCGFRNSRAFIVNKPPVLNPGYTPGFFVEVN